jgi:carbamoyl-phosphate synthase small subunit
MKQSMINNKPAILILENGKIFKGYTFGSVGYSIGEVCFNTGMTGYQEILTDPSYAGQLITMTYPHIGNYGVNDEDIESNTIHAKGLIIKDGMCRPSNYRAKTSLNKYLKDNNIVAIQGIDTRSLVKCIRNEGAMNGIISNNFLEINKLKKILSEYPKMTGKDLAREVTCKKTYILNENKNFKKIVIIDFGIKKNILNLLSEQKMELIILPATSNVEDILYHSPDGIFLSNGPGDPAAVTYAINTVKELLKINIPIFGICLGHQILSLALGAKTYKLKFGHRGCNHPVKSVKYKKIEITSQNHGFSVDEKTIPENVIVTHYSLNDNTVEGIKCLNKPAFSVQYHPEGSPGPHDSKYLFKTFEQLIKKSCYAKTQ